MMNPLFYPILLPFIFGLMILWLPARWKEVTALVASGLNLVICLALFTWLPLSFGCGPLNSQNLLTLDSLSGFILIFQAIFGVLAVVYSPACLAGKKGHTKEYYTYLLWTLAATAGAIFAAHLLLLLIFWNILGILLYLLVNLSPEESAAASAKKMLIIIGGTDSLFILGIAIIFSLTGTLALSGGHIPLGTGLAYLAFFSLVSAALAKAGAFPFHTWLPEIAGPTAAPVMAFLPASLDKLVGIYFLFRICRDLFVPDFLGQTVLLAIGAATIIFAVMMALVQHNFKKLLAYHAVSQVGYMVLGIGIGTPLGFAGALFHMLNHAIYKQGLFLVGGNVEKEAGSVEIDDLGGLGRRMKWSFFAFLILSLAISGVPPLNGFYSKWLVYLGLLEMGQSGHSLWVVWIAAAMFGSALTLASFMKLVHAIFLGIPNKTLDRKKVREAPPSMVIPAVFLAVLCVLFGVLAKQLPLRFFILPAVGSIQPAGLWLPDRAAFLIVITLVLGLLVFGIGRLKKMRLTPTYLGGEEPDLADYRPTGSAFYETVREMGFIGTIYRLAEKKLFDLYELGKGFTLTISAGLRKMHSGILPNYLSWVLVGLVILLWVLAV